MKSGPLAAAAVAAHCDLLASMLTSLRLAISKSMSGTRSLLASRLSTSLKSSQALARRRTEDRAGFLEVLSPSAASETFHADRLGG
jgi:hypothetical protein